MVKVGKTISLLLVLCLAIGLIFAGCGKEGENPVKDRQTTETASDGNKAATENKYSEPVKLNWVALGPGKQVDADRVWAEFNKKLPDYLPNTQVELEIISAAEFKQKWDLMMAGGEEVDIAWTGYVIPFAEEVAKGSYMQMNQLIDQYAPDIKKELPEWVLGLGSVGEGIFQIPCYQMTTELKMGVFTPKELYEKYWDGDNVKSTFLNNTELPYRAGTGAMYDEFEAYMKKLADNGEIRSGFSPWVWYMNFGTVLAGWDNAPMFRLPKRGQAWDFTVCNYFELPETKLLFDTMADWYKKGYVRKDVLSLQNPREFEKGAENGYVAWFHGYTNDADPTAEYKDIINAANTVDIVQVPIENDFYISRLDSSTGLSIARTCRNPERAMELIGLMNTQKGKDLYNLLVWGFEGEHYNKISENRIETIGYSGQGTPDAKYGLAKWTMGNTFNSYFTQTDSDNYLSYVENEIHGKAIVSPLLGLKPDTDPIKNELAQCKAVVAEYSKPLLSGALPDHEAKYKEFLSKLKAAGIDKVLLEYQKQVDEFLKIKGIPKEGYIAK